MELSIEKNKLFSRENITIRSHHKRLNTQEINSLSSQTKLKEDI